LLAVIELCLPPYAIFDLRLHRQVCG
jgi:hypothetical protein